MHGNVPFFFQPVKDKFVNKFILRLSLDHTIPLLPQPSYHSKDWDSRVNHFMFLLTQSFKLLILNQLFLTLQQCLKSRLDIVYGNQSSSSPNTCTAMNKNLILIVIFLARRMKLLHVIQDLSNNFIIGFFWDSVIWPGKVLQVHYCSHILFVLRICYVELPS